MAENHALFPSTQYLLGIDFGTESCRAAVFTTDGAQVAFWATRYPTSFPRPGWAEQDPEDWRTAMVASTRKAMTLAGVNAADIAGIGYAATSHTLVTLDPSCRPLRPAIMWMDVRASTQASRTGTSRIGSAARDRTANVPASAEMLPFKAAWIRENEPQLYRQAAVLLDAPDWVGYLLTGVLRTNQNSAAIKMYYDQAVGGFPVEFFADVGCGDVLDKLPTKVQPLGTLLGRLTTSIAEELGLRAGTPVAEGCIDAYAGQIGLNVLTPGSLALITGSSHALIGQAPSAVASSGLVGAYPDAVIPGECTVEAALVSSGSALRWFRDEFAAEEVRTADRSGRSAYDLLNQASRRIPPGSDGLIVVPHFQGARNPIADSSARAVIWGLSLHHTKAHIYHALQEGICYGIAQNIRHLQAHGVAVSKLVACGGALHSREWMQMHADITGLRIVLPKVRDAVSLGTCAMAAAGAGILPSVADAAAAMFREADVLEPNPALHDEYAVYSDKYAETYPRLQGLQRDLARHSSPLQPPSPRVPA